MNILGKHSEFHNVGTLSEIFRMLRTVFLKLVGVSENVLKA